MMIASTERYGFLEMPDFIVIAIYLVISVGLGVWFVRRGTKDTKAYFAGSGAIPWWIAGTSLLVACFAADTPLWIGDIIYKRGLEGAWLYWAPAIGTAFFVMLIAPLWKRSGIMTDLEFLEFRYRGKAASVMRCLNSVYYSLFFSIMLMGLQTLSIVKIMQATTEWSKLTCVLVTMAFAASYSVISGLWGVASSGALQFLVTYIGSVILAIFAVVYKAGGLGPMLETVRGLDDWPQGQNLNIAPSLGGAGLPMMTLFFLFVFRWIEQTGMGQYVAQRLIATKNTRQAVFTAMIWGVGFFAIVPLPWIVTVVAAKVVLPGVTDGQEAYPRMAMLLPVGLKGVLVASMLAAFMSTYSSLMSWGSSYAIHDLYQRFLVKNASEHHYVRVGQLFMLPMALVSGAIAMYAESVLNIIFVVTAATTGYYTVMIARWLWWRVNAWGEVVGLTGSIFFALVCAFLPQTRHWWQPELMEQYYGHRMVFIMVGTLVAWIVVTLLTKPTAPEQLDEFYRKTRPPGFWGPVRRRLGLPLVHTPGSIASSWIIMLVAIYGPLLGFIKMVFGDPTWGGVLVVAGAICLGWAVRRTKVMYAD